MKLSLTHTLLAVALTVAPATLVGCAVDAGDDAAQAEEQDVKLRSGKFELFQGLDGKFYFHLRAKNGEIVLQSQAYASKSSAQKGVSSVELNGQKAANFQVRPAADGQYYFVLRANNSKVVGLGQTYASKSDAQHG